MHCVRHGVFLRLGELGIFLTGDSGIGKSELALDLIQRGHVLIADDATRFEKKEGLIVGSCPDSLQDFLQIRGLGVLNIRKMYGDHAVQKASPLSLIIQLVSFDHKKLDQIDPLQIHYSEQLILNTPIQTLTIPVSFGRKLAIIVEAAVNNHQLRLQGYEAGQDFLSRQQKENKQ